MPDSLMPPLTATVTLWLNESDVPVIVTKHMPLGVGPATPVVMVAEEVWFDPLRDTGLREKLQAILAGSPEQLSCTGPVNPFSGATVTVNVVESVERACRVEGDAE